MRLKKALQWSITEHAIRSCSVLWQFQDYDLKIRSWLSLLYWFPGWDKLLLRDPELKIHVMVFIPSTCSRVTSRLCSRIWCGAMWHVCHLRADSVVWLSHTSSVWPWSGAPKVHVYDTFLGGLHHSPPWMKNQHGLNEEKTLIGKKSSLNWVLVMWHVWLVWILTTKHKFLKWVENLERYVIFSYHYSLILLIKQFMFCCVHLLFRFILQMVLLSGYLSFWICSTFTPDCLFICLWRNDAQIFYFCGVYLFVSIQFLPLKVWSSLLIGIERWCWRSSVVAFVLQL